MKLFSTSCETIYLGWHAPLLPRVSEYLCERFAKDSQWDLSSLICVLPTSRGADRFAQLLRCSAVDSDFDVQLPQIVTVGELPERLYQSPRPLALEFEQTLAWARVLSSRETESLRPLLRDVPPSRPIGPWIELGSTLRRLHEELSACERTFADVIELTESGSEQQRWQLLTDLYNEYIAQLSEAGLCDPHWARRDALLRNGIQTDKTLVLIGVSDVSDILVSILRALDADMISMIAAPESDSFGFDEFGCADTEYWTKHELPISDEQLVAAGDVLDQAVAVAEAIADFSKAHSADEVTVGVTDESQIGPIEIELSGCGASTRRQIGWTVSSTSVGRLLELTSTYLQYPTWQSLAALVRHHDVHKWISEQLELTEGPESWLIQLDRMLAEHYPIHMRDSITDFAAQSYPLVNQVADVIKGWLSPLENDSNQKPISQWCETIESCLGQLFSGELEDRRRTELAWQSFQRLLKRFSSMNQSIDVEVSGRSALEAVTSRLADLRVIQEGQPEDIEIVGWLDLALDDAPALVVAGLNHPFVPAAVTSDPFLPGTLRSQLRVADNERRYARDVYAMHLMLNSRSSVRFIVGRTAADGSPTPPSRLLAAAAPTDSARRIRHLQNVREPVVVQHAWDSLGENRISIPELSIDPDTPIVPYMSVTAFRDYLNCPYRFFLRHVLKMRPLDDAGRELAANQFGDLVHGTLESFGESPDKDQQNPSVVEKLLIEHLHAYAQKRYGNAVSTAVKLQIAQAERRLKAVALQQAKRASEGWQIVEVEAAADPKNGAGIDVDGQWMGLSGRFDRIDYHPDLKKWAILDYKTHGHKPERKHLKRTADGEKWIDLQLPLYRLMIPFLNIKADPSDVQLGYFNISEKDSETVVNIADFSPQQLDAAEQMVHQVVRDIRDHRFEPTSARVMFDDYEMILQTGVSDRLLGRDDLVVAEEVDNE